MIDIYNKLPTDLNYQVACETNDEIEYILALIKMMLGTKPGDILGEPYFGVDISKYLFSMSYNQELINQIITEGILTDLDYDDSKYTVSVNVEFGKDAESASDYAVIFVSINQNRCLGVVINQ